MTYAKRRCRVQLCPNLMNPGYFVCPRHWRRVPAELKKAFSQAFSGGKADQKVEIFKTILAVLEEKERAS